MKIVPTLIIILCVLLAGCEVDQAPLELKPTGTIEPAQEETVDVIPQRADDVFEANNQFALEFYSELRSEDGNIFFSPYSISTALAITYEGTKGQTADEIAYVFHFPEDDEARFWGFEKSIERLNKKDAKHEVHTANALWAQKNYHFLESYLNLIESKYKGEAMHLDLAESPEESRIIINRWIEQQTNHKIKDAIPRGSIESLTRLIITNAIYFKGMWLKTFDSEGTFDGFFHTPSEAVNVPMMNMQDEEFNYAETEELQILEMLYDGEELSMIILLPKSRDLGALERSLNTKNLLKWKGMLTKQKIDELFIPKFKMDTKYFMAGNLKAMGMPTAFIPGKADLSGIDGSRMLYIDQVIHQAFVEVNEEGTEAAAATVVMIKAISANIEPEEEIIFNVNRPFVFIIQERDTGNILFLGRVVDPNQ